MNFDTTQVTQNLFAVREWLRRVRSGGETNDSDVLAVYRLLDDLETLSSIVATLHRQLNPESSSGV